jgi:hypothetical protein
MTLRHVYKFKYYFGFAGMDASPSRPYGRRNSTDSIIRGFAQGIGSHVRSTRQPILGVKPLNGNCGRLITHYMRV